MCQYIYKEDRRNVGEISSRQTRISKGVVKELTCKISNHSPNLSRSSRVSFLRSDISSMRRISSSNTLNKLPYSSFVRTTLRSTQSIVSPNIELPPRSQKDIAMSKSLKPSVGRRRASSCRPWWPYRMIIWGASRDLNGFSRRNTVLTSQEGASN